MLKTVTNTIPISSSTKLENVLRINTTKPHNLSAGDEISVHELDSAPQSLTIDRVPSPTSLEFVTTFNLSRIDESHISYNYYTSGDVGLQKRIEFQYGLITFTHTGTGASDFSIGFSNDGVNVQYAANCQLSNTDATATLNVTVNWEYMHIKINSIAQACKLAIQWEGK